MSIPARPDPAKLVVGVFTKDTDIIEDVAQKLVDRFGDVDLVSRLLEFDYTDYYTDEFGAPLYRRVFSFSRLIDQQDLPAIKIFTNKIEHDLGQDNKRLINIDPGYMLPEKFVLATGKNYSHRIYIGEGIYADLTLMYQNKTFQTLPWTYPDYADEPMQSFLMQIRERYMLDLKTVNRENI